MIPPTRPNITRLTDESVMVRWSVPPNEGLPIEFFKVQYKEADKRGSRWKTIDEDIPSHIRSYEVNGLKPGQTYRFRIAAVYSNNDNKLGPNSGRFLLEKEAPKRKPGYSPLIDVAEAVSQSAVMIQWKVRVWSKKIFHLFISLIGWNILNNFSTPSSIAFHLRAFSFTIVRRLVLEITPK